MSPSVNNSINLSAVARDGISTRLLWLAYLTTMALGCILAFYSVLFLRADFFLGAMIAGAVSLLARSVLRERLAVSTTDDELSGTEDDFLVEEESVRDGRVSGLVRLLHELEVMERSRGTANFDPWALQSTRNEIRSAVHGDPTLERLFRARE